MYGRLFRVMYVVIYRGYIVMWKRTWKLLFRDQGLGSRARYPNNGKPNEKRACKIDGNCDYIAMYMGRGFPTWEGLFYLQGNWGANAGSPLWEIPTSCHGTNRRLKLAKIWGFPKIRTLLWEAPIRAFKGDFAFRNVCWDLTVYGNYPKPLTLNSIFAATAKTRATL